MKDQHNDTGSAASHTRTTPCNSAIWLAEALRLAVAGRRVIPLWWVLDDGECACGDEAHKKARRAGRHPLVTSHSETSSDPETIKAWAARWPEANLGLMIEPDEFWLDVDRRNGGRATMKELVAACGKLPWGPKALTGSGDGSSHRPFKRPPGDLVHDLGPGVDVLTVGYVLVEPSRTSAPYVWQPEQHLLERELPDLPPKWVARLTKNESSHRQDKETAPPFWTQAIGERVLENALAETKPKTRNKTCTELLKQARDNGSSRNEADALLRRYVEQVRDEGNHPFTEEEALAILDRIYAKPAGEPWDLGEYHAPIPFAAIVREEYTEEPSLLGHSIITRGSLNLLAGESGVSKTSFAIQLSLCLAAGVNFLGMEIKTPVTVLYLLAEGNRQRTFERVLKAADEIGLDLAKLPVYGLQHRCPPYNFIDPRFERQTMDVRAGFVVADTHGYFHEGDDNSRTDWKRFVVRPLRGISARTGAAVLLLDHFNKFSGKGRKRDYRSRIAGAGNKTDDLDSVFALDWPRGEADTYRLLDFTKLRNDPKHPPMELSLDPDTGTFSIIPGSTTPGRTLLATRREALKKLLAHGPMKKARLIAKLRRQLDLGESAIEKLVDQAAEDGHIRKTSHGVYGLNEESEE
jgi:hypothetical protein